MWIFLWALVSLFILGVFGWSVRILFQQKAAWKSYAEKMKLSYRQPKGWLVSPVVTGPIGNIDFGLFSEAQSTADSRGQRYSTVLEFGLRQSFPISGVIGTARTYEFIESLNLGKGVSIEDKDWDANWLIRTDHPAVFEKYMTTKRIELIKKLFGMKANAMLYIFNDQNAVLRIELADPLNDAQRLEKIVKSLIGQLNMLMPSAEEFTDFQSMAGKNNAP